MPPSSLDASARPPPNGPLPEPPSSSITSPPPKQQKMLPKSSTIVAKSNYVSPYRQVLPSRSVSTPLTKSGSSTGNTHSPNFKDIVSRFNNKQDEKIPNPSNRIPAVAVAAGPVGYKTRKSPAWKPAGGNGQTASRSSSSLSNGRGKGVERSMSAQSLRDGNRGERAGGNAGSSSSSNGPSQRLKSRKASNASDSGLSNPRNLPPLDTSVNDKHLQVNNNNGHRRSRSALEIHSPSAASLADTEGETYSPGAGTPLRHRRSRSNIEIYGSPDEFEMDPIFARSTRGPMSARSPPPNKSNIPLPKSRVASPSSPNPRRKGNGSKAESLAPIAVSSHGSRRTPQPISSPRLAAYISAPPPAKSPPLRSSRNRLQTANSVSSSSRQKFQNGQSPTTPPGGYTKDVGIQRGRGVRSSSVGENRGKEVKRKIPELGQVDFAARRARIQSAFNRTLKETNEGQVKVVSRGHSKRSVRGEIEEETLRSAVSERIDEEDEDQEEPVGFQIQPTDGEIKVETSFQEPGETEPMGANLDTDSPVDLSLEAQVEEDNFQEALEVPDTDVYERPESQASTISRNSSESSFEDDIPFSNEDTISPRTRARPFSLIEPRREEPSIPLIVTPDSPNQPPLLTQVSKFLRPDSNWSGWSISSEYSRDLPPPVPDMPAHHMFNSVGVVVDPPPSDQREATTSPTDAYIPIMLSREKGGLSPVSPMNSNKSDTPIDDRATIVDVLEHYDEPREDFLKSYANTEADFTDREMETQDEYEEETQDEYQGEETEDGEDTEAEHERDETETDETEGEYSHCDGEYDEQYDSTSCSEVPDSARPSTDDQSDGWTSASPSPEMDVHPARRISMNSLLDSPTTPRQFHDMEEIDSPLPPTPPPKDSHFLPPVPPAKDPPRAVSPSPSAMSVPPVPTSYSGYTNHRMPTYGFPSYPLQLPEIQRDTEPLGLAIQVPLQHDEPSSVLPDPPANTRPNFDRWHTAPTMESQTESSRPSLDYQSSSYMGSRQSLDQYSSQRPSLDQSHAGKSSNSPSSSFYSEIESRLSNASTGQNGHRNSETPASSTAPTKRESSSIHSQEQILPQIPPELKMMTKRRHLLKELVDTECSYFRDMTVAMEIYKGSANACAAITLDDIKVLFGNTDSIVQFSKAFLESLRMAVGSVYVMRRARSGVASSAASIAGSVISSDERNSGLMEDFEQEEEKDRKTYVGEVFMDMFYNMEKVYGEYCKNHDNAVGRLAKLQDNRGVAIWLTECKTCAEDLTSAWNLESLLIKPVQRILKYPLLLTQLLECTPRSHPDYIQLDVAAKEMKFVANRINEMKKRKDMVEKIVGRGGKRQESDIGHGITKAFARRAEKLKQSVGLSEVVVDGTYNQLFENYNMHFVQVQVIIRDIEIYNLDIQGHVEKFLEYTQTIQQFVDFSHSQYAELEMKWRKFDSAMRELATTYLTEHKLRVRKHAIEPLEMLLKMHESPQRIMTKRNKKAVDYARFRAVKERGDTPDKKTKDLADAYLALNETLIDELPKLFRLTKRLVDAVLTNFVELQALWMNSWASKIKMTFPELATSESLEDIVKGFEGDFSYNENILGQLGVCNGSLKAALMPPPSSSLSPSVATLSLEAFEDPAAHRRPSTGTMVPEARDPSPGARDRAMSLTTHSPTASSFFDKSERFFDNRSERRYSGGSALSPLVAMAPGVLPLLPNLAQSPRNRSPSVAHTLPHRTPSMSSLNPQVQRSYSERQPTANRDFSRPSSRTYSLAETLFDGPETQTAYASSSSLIDPRVESRNPSRAPSPAPPSVFSSAMPMDDDREMKGDSYEPSGSPRNLSRTPSRAPSVASSMHSQRRTLTLSGNSTPIFVAASLYEFNIDKQRREGGFPYLTYVEGEIFDVVGTKGEIWLAKNQDDKNGELGWIWCKHFARL